MRAYAAYVSLGTGERLVSIPALIVPEVVPKLTDVPQDVPLGTI